MKKFEVIAHENGTHSLRDLRSGEAMHSRIGPSEEAEKLYVNQSKFVKRLETPGKSLCLWDVGMGTGANVLVALEHLKNSQPARHLAIHSFESELAGIQTALEHFDQFPFIERNAEAVRELLRTRHIERDRFSWTLHEGDFKDRFQHVPPPEIIFYDFYAPKTCPELWNADCFRKIRNALGQQYCDLYTYSSSTSVRAAMLCAGFYVGSGLGTTMKMESTIASTVLERLENPLRIDRNWLEKLGRSGRISPFDLQQIQGEISASRQFKG